MVKKILRAGFSMIKMVGGTVQTAIAEAREKVPDGFKSLKHFLETIDRRKANRRVIKMMIDAGCFDALFSDIEKKLWKLHFDELYDSISSEKKHLALIEEKKKTLEEDWDVGYDNVVFAQQDALNFSIDNDIYGKYRKLVNFLKTKLTIHDIGDIDDSKKSTKPKLYIAQATSIKFGYSERAKKAATGKAGTADALGGVYGNLDDGTGYTMAVYIPKLYKKKKEKIEKIKGEVGVFRATHPMARKTNIWVEDFVRMKDIAAGRPGPLKIQAVEELQEIDGYKEFKNEVRACERCSLRKSCKAPVPPSLGSRNLMVIGEAPGADEDEQGVGYVGRAGEVLWRELRRVGITREQCIVANTLCCRPPNNKIPNITLVGKCPWPGLIISQLAPKFILATGNAALYYFKRQPKGITEMSGKTEWDNRVGAWITYSVHPSSTFYHQDNIQKFREAVEKFATTISAFV